MRDQHDMAGDEYSSFHFFFSPYKTTGFTSDFNVTNFPIMDMLYESFLRGVILTFELKFILQRSLFIDYTW